MPENERLESKYTMEVTNSEGVKTIEGQVIVRDQSPASASKMLIGALEGILAPAREQANAG